MRKLKMAVGLLAGLFLLAGVAQARDWSEIKKSGTIIAVTEGAFYPFNYFEGSKITGFEVDVAEAVAKQMGLKIEWRVVPFDAEVAAIRQNRFDFAIASHGYTEERAKAVDFANPHYCTGGQIVGHKNGPLTVAALSGKTVAVQLATSYFDHAKKIPGVKEVKTYKSDPEAFAALKANKVDAWISDKWLVKADLEKNPDPNVTTGEQVFVERVSAIMAKNNTELKSQFNQALDAIMKNGTYQTLSNKYFKTDISCH